MVVQHWLGSLQVLLSPAQCEIAGVSLRRPSPSPSHFLSSRLHSFPFVSISLLSVLYSFNPSPIPPLFSSPHFNLLVLTPLFLPLFSFSSSPLTRFLLSVFLSSFHSALNFLIFIAHYFSLPFLNLLYLLFFFLSNLTSCPPSSRHSQHHVREPNPQRSTLNPQTFFAPLPPTWQHRRHQDTPCKTTTVSVILSARQLFCNSTANSLIITNSTASNLVTTSSLFADRLAASTSSVAMKGSNFLVALIP